MEQSWIMGLIGGLIIGCAGAVYLLMNGRIMGASGVIGGFIDGSGRNMERGSFLAGLFIVPAILAATVYPSQTNVTSNLFIVAAAGLLVGIGTRIANGCTSGHGVCGISRLSLRGIVATVFYILAGGLTVVLFRHILGVI
ncbi:YeeE/YedE family protein [Falsihalocynthiibacter sp. BN13B15]|uniref:YeeE/YedE family protein n=1 Tax=Falsihalocynthiibacter sp. BN13B15 TaxID=3240871 RepID=UPI00350FF473